ncbi:MAG: redoxin domain-containing protein [Saprospiraceae bacterium]|nr:redoxin domain-containing protein [Saprospiraceae bacterium]
MSSEKNQPLWSQMVTSSGDDLYSICLEKPVLLVFLRFFGCSFCREAISDISKRRQSLEKQGFRLVLVHLAEDAAVAERFFKRYKLFPIDHIGDPEMRFYREFGLGKAAPAQLMGFMNWIRGFQAVVIEGHGGSFSAFNPELGDGFQMPGVFVLFEGEIRRSFIHKHPYDRPDYEEICQI